MKRKPPPSRAARARREALLKLGVWIFLAIYTYWECAYKPESLPTDVDMATILNSQNFWPTLGQGRWKVLDFLAFLTNSSEVYP